MVDFAATKLTFKAPFPPPGSVAPSTTGATAQAAFEVFEDIIKHLDYTCFPKILQVNRELRAWALDHWTDILNERPKGWIEKIPKDVAKKLNSRYVKIIQKWSSIQTPSVVKAVLLRGTNIDHCIHLHLCMRYGYFDLADIRN